MSDNYGSSTADLDALEATVKRQTAAAQSGSEGGSRQREMSGEELQEMLRSQQMDLSDVSDGMEPWVKGTWLCECEKVEYFGPRVVVDENGNQTSRFPYVFLHWRCLHGPNINRQIRDRVMLGGNKDNALTRFKILARACGLLKEWEEGGKKKAVFTGSYQDMETKLAWVSVEPKETKYTQGPNAGKTFVNDSVTFNGYAHLDSKPLPPELAGGDQPVVAGDPFVETTTPASLPAGETVATGAAAEPPPAPAAGTKTPWG